MQVILKDATACQLDASENLSNRRGTNHKSADGEKAKPPARPTSFCLNAIAKGDKLG